MKTLVIQLARLGDIYLTWPALRALQRSGHEVHLLVRKRFLPATEGLTGVTVHCLDTPAILQPLFQDQPDPDAALGEISSLLTSLQSQGFERILNLSFSPVASFLTHALTTPTTQVGGYTRHSDGFFTFAEEISGYFFSQVGIDRRSRIHISDIFSGVIKADFLPEDWQAPQVAATVQPPSQPYVAMHIGASQTEKTYGGLKWRQVITGLLKNWQGAVVILGSAEEKGMATQICDSVSDERVLNLVGQTQLAEIFPILQGARLVVGCDSVVMHMASMTRTPTLNLSFASVNFWETGPLAPNSRVVKATDAESLPSDLVVGHIRQMLGIDSAFDLGVHYVVDGSGLEKYRAVGDTDPDVAWDIIRFLYFSGETPAITDGDMVKALSNVYELSVTALQQMDIVLQPEKRNIAIDILLQVDTLLETIEQRVPEVSPVVRWIRSERVQIGPMPVNEVLTRTIQCFERLSTICVVLLSASGQTQGGGVNHADHEMGP